ncbi:AMP-binding protein [Rhodococcus oxybenzonivorans]|uniref:AMP-binding protein n=1 Tax=Rhodococcus oxybenzonivorans TaxID=1990687 RepID=A0A2S2C489_9NOCA|nr:fatty acyl-AMP ligase [Rhodococcus oxybenzonivorans]AWK75588.1 AMP-binding protein [Rhodococcus oxybenzonivorans]
MHSDFVSHVRAQAATYGEERSYTYHREVGRELVEEVLTYRQLDQDARAIASWLSTRPEAHRPVMLLYVDGIDFLRAFLGCLYAGVVAVPAPVPHDARSMARVATMFEDADVGLVLTTSAIEELLTAWIGNSGLTGTVAVASTDAAELGDPDEWQMPELDGDTLALLQYTSGSTSEPKGVMVTHGNLLHNAAAMVEAMSAAIRDGDAGSVVGWLPHFHDMGLIGMLLLPLYAGSNLAFMSPMTFLKRPVRWLQLIDRYRADITVGPNFAYDLLARRIPDDQLTGLDLSSVRVALNGAEPIRPRTLEAVLDRLRPYGFRADAFFPAYGMAEVTLLATAGAVGSPPVYLDVDPAALERNELTPMAGGTRLVSSGRAFGVDIRVVDPDTTDELPEGRVGELWIRGGSVTAGYWNRPEDTEEKFHATTLGGDGPFLRTGDLGASVGREIFVTGRLKDLLIVNGRNLYPQDIEEAVRELHPALTGSAGVVFSMDTGRHERLLVIHEVKTGLLDQGQENDTVTITDLARKIKLSVARAFDVPAPSVVLVDRHGVHRTTSGKVQRRSMRASFLENRVDAVLHEEIDPAVQGLRRTATPAHA